ncbi:MAG: hypothetical protein ACPG7F_11075 [Aggregatilineales bacterium]
MAKRKDKVGIYAQGTTTSVIKSVQDIERTIERYGATGFEYYQSSGAVGVGFRYGGHAVKFMIQPMPDSKKETRQRYRVLLTALKMKLEMIHLGIRTFEEEFLGDLQMSDGTTISERILPQIRSGQIKLLPAPKVG